MVNITKLKCAVSALLMIKCFIVESWRYITTKRLKSKVEFFTGITQAWCKFMIATYKDNLIQTSRG